MSARFNHSDADQASRTTNLMPIATFTMMAWVRLTTNTANYTPFLLFGDSSGALFYLFATDAGGLQLVSYNGSALSASGATLVLGTWVHLAMVVAGTGVGQFRCYVDAVLNITHDGNAAVSAVNLTIANKVIGDGQYLDGCVAAVKLWDVALTATEIAAERRQYAPVRTANLNSFYPMLTAADVLTDYSGNGRTATLTGAVSTEDGPPIPWSLPLLNQLAARRAATARTAVRRASAW